MDISQSAGLSNACVNQPVNNLQEEQLRCFWSIVLLKRLHGNLSGAFSITINEKAVPVYPYSSSRPSFSQGSADTEVPARLTSDFPDLGIMAYAIQLAEIWQRVAHYAHRRRTPGSHPPWSPESEYASILARQMERETLMPYTQHRFKPARFSERSIEELRAHRDYWGPWLLNQMMYHTIICLLNHPLLLSLRLRHFKVASIPEIWLQHTDDLVSSHTQWVIHLIDLTEVKDFDVSDPFLAHCAAIVATIYLQQSFVEDRGIQRVKRDNYLKCLNFCEKLGRKWPLIEALVGATWVCIRLMADLSVDTKTAQIRACGFCILQSLG